MVFILERGFDSPRDRHYYHQYINDILCVSYKNHKGFKNKSYVGFTNNIKSRLIKHNTNKGAKATRGYKWELVYKKSFFNKSKALSYEYELKKDRWKRFKLINVYNKKKY